MISLISNLDHTWIGLQRLTPQIVNRENHGSAIAWPLAERLTQASLMRSWHTAVVATPADSVWIRQLWYGDRQVCRGVRHY
jgi:hypothetical protein